MMSPLNLNRRAFLASTAMGALASGLAGPASAGRLATADTDGEFQFEVRRSEGEWRSALDPAEFEVLREGKTEAPFSSPFWDDYSAGDFHCRGCDLHLYASTWRANIDKGWVFFDHSMPNAVLTGIDAEINYSMDGLSLTTGIEVHCRRCGSHLGHVLLVDGGIVHCINGVSLGFVPAQA